MSPEWQDTFINIALAISGKSKDTSTKVGSVLVRPDMTVASLGFNGFPKRMADKPEHLGNRDEKIKRIIHSEQNCLRFNRDATTDGYHLFVSRHPCAMCALEICCTDIGDVWYLSDIDFETRWSASLEQARQHFDECGIRLHRVR